MSMSYHDRDSFTLTTTTYNVSNSARIGVVEAVQKEEDVCQVSFDGNNNP